MGWFNQLFVLKDSNNQTLPEDVSRKVLFELIKYVYSQMLGTIVSSTICASIIAFDLYLNNPSQSNGKLSLWVSFYVCVALIRYLLYFGYKKLNNLANKIFLWRNLYIIGSALGGISWGILGWFILPDVLSVQQTLILFMLACVIGGSVLLSAGIPQAAICFLLFSLVPFIVSIVFIHDVTYMLFDIALVSSLVFSTISTIRSYRLISSSLILQFENHSLLLKLENSNKRLHEAATHDPLTRVANRRLFELNLEESIKIANNTHQRFALFYVDLDKFKFINDHYGHHVGDHVLLEVIARLSTFFRKNDMISRLGGDEFAIIIDTISSYEAVRLLANRVCELIAKPIKMNGLTLQVSASIGISVYPDNGQDEISLLRNADNSMYSAKEHGGNQFCFSKQVEANCEVRDA